MSLDDKFLRYDKLRRGMDHERYAWTMLEQRSALNWPVGKSLALWINVSVEHFPLNPDSAGFKAPGNMTMPYPDLRHYTLRDYGNRVGIFRILEALERHDLEASFAINGELAQRYPYLVRRLAERGEIIAHGWNMDCTHHSGVDPATEQHWINATLDALAHYSNQPVRGWLGPARSQSFRTPELLAQAGIRWMADWVNDELPYSFNTEHGPLVNLPLSLELEDRFIIGDNLHSETEYGDQIIDAADFLLDEAQSTGHGRLLALNLHPWVIGQPHRIGQLERIFAHLAARRQELHNTLPSELAMWAKVE